MNKRELLELLSEWENELCIAIVGLEPLADNPVIAEIQNTLDSISDEMREAQGW